MFLLKRVPFFPGDLSPTTDFLAFWIPLFSAASNSFPGELVLFDLRVLLFLFCRVGSSNRWIRKGDTILPFLSSPFSLLQPFVSFGRARKL